VRLCKNLILPPKLDVSGGIKATEYRINGNPLIGGQWTSLGHKMKYIIF
jgi:hypothetical protein